MPGNQTKTLMLVGAHHDDNELMAGTIARHVAAGWRVISLVVTNGRYARGESHDRNIEIRNNESRAAAKLLGVECVFLGFDEGGFRNTEQARSSLVVQIRRCQPQVVVTHPPLDYHSDHMAACKCTEDATLLCPDVYDCGEPPCARPNLYYCDAWFVPFQPDVYVDVSAYIDLKVQALAAHKSQLGPQGPAPNDMIDMEKTRARFRGFEAGFTYAEAFRLVPRLQQVRTADLLA